MKVFLLIIAVTFLHSTKCSSQNDASNSIYKYEITMADSFMGISDYQQAIYFYTKFIEKEKENTDYKLYAFAFRSLSKVYAHDYRGAILDANEALSMSSSPIIPKLAHRLDLQSEVDDWNGYAYLSRGMAESSLGLSNEACVDWSKAGERGRKEAYKYIQQHCN